MDGCEQGCMMWMKMKVKVHVTNKLWTIYCIILLVTEEWMH